MPVTVERIELSPEKIGHHRKIPTGFRMTYQGAHQLAVIAQETVPPPIPIKEDVWQPPSYVDQRWVLEKALTDEEKLNLETTLPHPDLHGLTAHHLLLEYATAQLARQKALWEVRQYHGHQIGFAIPGPGTELIFISDERNSVGHKDAVLHYYRYEASDLLRQAGPESAIRAMLAQNRGSLSDTHSYGRNLPEHVANPAGGEVAASSWVGHHVYAAVGIGRALKRRAEIGTNDGWEHFNDQEAIVRCYIGDGAMAEPEVLAAISEMCLHDGVPMVLTIIDNGKAIATSAEDEFPGGDCLSAVRGLAQQNLALIIDTDGSSLQELFDNSQRAIQYSRETRKPAIHHIYNVPRLMSHSVSDQQEQYMMPSEITAMLVRDPLPLFRRYLLDHQVATAEVLNKIEEFAAQRVDEIGKEVLAEPTIPPEKLYHFVYAYEGYGPKTINPEGWQTARVAQLDYLPSSRANGEKNGVYYPSTYDTSTEVIKLREAVNRTLAQLMRDPRVIYTGEDTADFSTNTFHHLDELFEQKLESFLKRLANQHGTTFAREDIEGMRAGVKLIKEGRGIEVNPDLFAAICAIVGGKGGVFKVSQHLTLLYGLQQSKHSRLDEASIFGVLAGSAIAGLVPIGELQFLPYADIGRNQLKNYVATLLWRSCGQFRAGCVFIIQGGNRLGGVAAMGHGGANYGEYINIPGLITIFPAHTQETPGLIREAYRLALLGQPVVIMLPINQLNADKGHWQPKGHIPVGEAEIIHRSGDRGILVPTWSNNLPVVLEAAKEWQKDQIPYTIVNMRTLGPLTDIRLLRQLVKDHPKVLITQSERLTASAGEDLFFRLHHACQDLEPQIVLLSAREFRTPANRVNEQYALPQPAEVAQAGRELYHRGVSGRNGYRRSQPSPKRLPGKEEDTGEQQAIQFVLAAINRWYG